MNQYPPWQPIETAPKDNSTILLCVAGYEASAGHYNTFYAAWLTVSSEQVDESYDLDGQYLPDHWMPLPPTSTLDPT